MTDTELAFLKTKIDQVVLIETIQGQRFLAQILFVFDEGETPDLFCIEVESAPKGEWLQKGSHSLLLSDIRTVQPLPA